MNSASLKDLINDEIYSQTRDASESLYFNESAEKVEDGNHYNTVYHKHSLTTAEALAFYELLDQLTLEIKLIFEHYAKTGNYKRAPKGFAIYYISLVKSVSPAERSKEFLRRAALFSLLSVRDKESNIRFKLSTCRREIEKTASKIRKTRKLNKVQKLIQDHGLTISDIWGSQSSREIVEDRYCASTLNRELYIPETWSERKERVASY